MKPAIIAAVAALFIVVSPSRAQTENSTASVDATSRRALAQRSPSSPKAYSPTANRRTQQRRERDTIDRIPLRSELINRPSSPQQVSTELTVSASTSSPLAGVTGSDNCATASPIAGVGSFMFDTTNATGDLCMDGVTNGCPEHIAAEPNGCFDSNLTTLGTIPNDVWFCWTAPCDGAVQIDNCGGTVDTRLAVYQGCGCPVSDATLLRCDDDAEVCGLQSQVSFLAVSEQQYMIRIGASPACLLGGVCIGTDSFTIACQGAPCQQPVENCQSLDIGLGATRSDKVTVITADNFTPAADSSLTDVCWYGSYASDEPVPDAFEITYYADANGIPDSTTIIGGPFLQSAGALSVSGPVLVDDRAFPVFEYSATHAPVPVTGNQCYWIGIVNPADRVQEWFWQRGVGGNGTFLQDGKVGVLPDGFDTDDIRFGDMAFCLNETLGDASVCPPPQNPTCTTATNDCCIEDLAGATGCNDDLCCRNVCLCDDFCCTVAWDSGCAGMGASTTRSCTGTAISCDTDADCMTCNLSGITCDTSAECPAGETCQMIETCQGCGAAVLCEDTCFSCPNVTIDWIDPPKDVVDARAARDINQPTLRLGIDTITVGATGAVDNLGCWSLCETSSEGVPNDITAVVDNLDGTFTVSLVRPITPGAVTRVTYTSDNDSTQETSLVSHPANVTANSAATPQDITQMINFCFNGVGVPPFGLYSCDLNHSALTTPQDITTLINLLNGAGSYSSWNSTPLPAGPCP